VCSVWPERDGRRRIWRRRLAVPAGKRRRLAATPGVLARFLGRGGRGRQGGAGGELGGGRGGS
jgi:hypothetical protein